MSQYKILFIALFLCVFSINAQSNLNDYKYIIVPVKYDFQKSEDAYQLNSLTKFLFNKYGFQAFLSNENFPEDLKKNRCLALIAQLKDYSNMLTTKVGFNLVDCSNNIVFNTNQHKSKEKDYKAAYQASTRKAFEEIKEQGYVYSEPSKKESLKTDQNVALPVATVSVISEEKIQDNGKNEPIKQKKTVDVTNANIVLPVVAVALATENKTKETKTTVLYAQPIKNGYQLVNSEPKVIYILQKTNVKDVYLLKGNSSIVYKTNGIWKIEYYDNEKLISKELHLKFF